MATKPFKTEVPPEVWEYIEEQEREIVAQREALTRLEVEHELEKTQLYEVDDTVTIWDTPKGKKTSVESRIVRGFRQLRKEAT